MITFFFRRFAAYGIEGLFDAICRDTENSQKIELPKFSQSIWFIFQNILFANETQTIVNHVTGDTHYAILGLNKENFNILTIHDCVLLSRLSKKNLRYYLLKWLWFDLPVRRADIVTVISQKTYDELIQFTNCNPSKIKIIPNFVNPLFKPKMKDFNQNFPKLLHVGSTENKNLLRLIEAVKNVSCHLTIIGSPTENERALITKYGIICTIRSGLTQLEIIEQYEQADIVTFVSTYEGFGLPIIEAQSVGRVVITSKIAPMTEISGGGAHLVDPYNIDEMRAGINLVVNNSEYRNKLINIGFENIRKYQYDVVLKRYTDIYASAPVKNKLIK
jgi:glycosyltransferase involved in cell wall biosynthesis